MTNKTKKSRKKLWKNKRGQVRGVDFALAMLIFIIAFSQVILVLTSLMFPTLNQMETYSAEQEMNKVYQNVYYSKGTPENWAFLPSSDLTNFRLGLYSTSEDGLDFSKINRLVSDISEYWRITYVKAKTSYSLIRDFSIEIVSPLRLEVTGVSISFNTITVRGEVYHYTTLLEGAEITTFAINQDNQVAMNYTTTKLIGNKVSFLSTMDLTSSNAYSIVVFATFGGIYQDYRVLRLEKEATSLDYSFTNFDFRPFAYQSQTVSTTAVDVSYLRSPTSDEATAFIFYPYQSDRINYINKSLTKASTEEGDIYQGTQIPIPAKGLAIVLIQEIDSGEYKAGYIGLPMFLSNREGGIFAPSNTPSGTHLSMSHLIPVRGVLVQCFIKYW
ncbi:MAG: hypothetical protein ACTSYD_00315 [Candidatus Heimdallarchaeaceae archaeon]